jgi:HAD superfamily hydrolase (TIGR01509 family)
MTSDDAAGVLFDVDGTLVDTSYLHTTTWWQALHQHGHEVPMARIHRAIGMGSDRILDHLLGDRRDRGDDQKLTDAHLALFAGYWERLRPTPGAAPLLRACAGGGLRVVLASSASALELRALRAALDAEDALSAATNSDDAEQTKPAPDILTAALESAGLRAERVVFVGDAVWDVHSAAKLDIPCIGLTCGGISAAELREAGAVEVYEDPAGLLDAYDRSILTRR